MTADASASRDDDDERERRAWARSLWRHVGDVRPPFAVAPGPGQVSVWDFPRPPRIAPDAREVSPTQPGGCGASCAQWTPWL